MSVAMQPIYSQTVGSGGASSITFNNIPQYQGDLVLQITSRDSRTSATVSDVFISFNGDFTSSNYSRQVISSNTNTTAGAAYSTGSGFGFGSNDACTAGVFGTCSVYIPSYTSGLRKVLISEGANENVATSTYIVGNMGIWRNTSAITSMTISPFTGPFLQHSNFTLYAVLKSRNAPKASGGSITTDGRYWYHSFKNTGSSSFIPNQDLGADLLLIGAGGSGGFGGVTYSEGAGGGGAGAVLQVGGQLLKSGTSYSVSVGAGGLARTGTYQGGTNGGNSTFGSFIAYGGGAGNVGGGGAAGASGGGGGADGASRTGGSATYWIQGNNGGTGFGSVTPGLRGGGGGGGYNAVGATATSGVAGNGGIGTASFTEWGTITGTGQNLSNLVYYAGGGGGGTFTPGTSGTGGLGGGGNGSTSTSGIDGLANSGGGGGGSSSSNSANASGAGGSGVVIIRYSV
jgi:hypothetical protein